MKHERGNIYSSWWWTVGALDEHSSALVKLHVHCVPTLVTCTVHNATCLCTLCIVWQCLFQRLLLAGHPRTSVPPPKQLGLPAALPLLVTLHMCVLLIGASCVCLCVLLCWHLLCVSVCPALIGTSWPPIFALHCHLVHRWVVPDQVVTSSGKSHPRYLCKDSCWQ